MLGKLRPVGSQVPLPSKGPCRFPWTGSYGVEYFASGTDALAMAVEIAAMRKPMSDKPEVIIPGYACPDLIAAIAGRGAKPALVDVMDGTPFFDEKLLIAAITPATIAVVAVGFLGIPERLELLSAICSEHDLYLIEDSAQCFPPGSCARPVSDLVVVSFGRGKPINLMGGGALLYREHNSGECKRAINQYPEDKRGGSGLWHLKRVVFNILMIRFFFALMERVPLLGLGKTELKTHQTIKRKSISECLICGGIKEYWRRPVIHEWFDRNLDFLEKSGWKLLTPEKLGAGSLGDSAPRLRYSLLAPSSSIRDMCVAALNSEGIGANCLYGKALHEIDGVSLLIKGTTFPSADKFAARLLTLPCHEDVTLQDAKLIAKILESMSVRSS